MCHVPGDKDCSSAQSWWGLEGHTSSLGYVLPFQTKQGQVAYQGLFPIPVFWIVWVNGRNLFFVAKCRANFLLHAVLCAAPPSPRGLAMALEFSVSVELSLLVFHSAYLSPSMFVEVSTLVD